MTRRRSPFEHARRNCICGGQPVPRRATSRKSETHAAISDLEDRRSNLAQNGGAKRDRGGSVAAARTDVGDLEPVAGGGFGEGERRRGSLDVARARRRAPPRPSSGPAAALTLPHGERRELEKALEAGGGSGLGVGRWLLGEGEPVNKGGAEEGRGKWEREGRDAVDRSTRVSTDGLTRRGAAGLAVRNQWGVRAVDCG